MRRMKMPEATKLWIPDNSGEGEWHNHVHFHYYLSVLWGEQPEKDAEPTIYTFNSEREREAFMKGVKEAEGWMGSDWILHDEPQIYKPKQFDNYQNMDYDVT